VCRGRHANPRLPPVIVICVPCMFPLPHRSASFFARFNALLSAVFLVNSS
jgi:hypothetical protein